MTYPEMERWAKWWANRYRWASETRADIDAEDLTQAAMVGICNALECYDESGNWAAWSSYFIRKEIRALIGIKHGRIPPPLCSLDAPIADDSDESMIDLLADETAPDPPDVAEYNDLQKRVREAVARLTDDRQREVVERTQLNDEPQSAVAADFGVSTSRIQMLWTKAKRALQEDKALRTLADIELKTKFISRSSVQRFYSTNTSDVEAAVLWREREREALAEKIKRLESEDYTTVTTTI